jgi:hypothetical protein
MSRNRGSSSGMASFEQSVEPESITMTSKPPLNFWRDTISITDEKVGSPFLTGMIIETRGEESDESLPTRLIIGVAH